MPRAKRDGGSAKKVPNSIGDADNRKPLPLVRVDEYGVSGRVAQIHPVPQADPLNSAKNFRRDLLFFGEDFCGSIQQLRILLKRSSRPAEKCDRVGRQRRPGKAMHCPKHTRVLVDEEPCGGPVENHASGEPLRWS
jgi:hypothetical protein